MSRNNRKKSEIICDFCKKTFLKETYEIKRYDHNFCCSACLGNYNTQIGTFKTICCNCNQEITKMFRDLRKSKSGKLFCSRTCSAIFSNKERKRIIRSKIEMSFFEKLCSLFPDLNIIPNDKEMLNGLEVDVAIPSLKLAIEWNGIVHFKPIYGQKSLNKIINRDQEKLKIASSKDINLIIISDLDSKETTLNNAITEVQIIINDLLKIP